MLEIEGLTKRYHRVAALQDVSFSIRPGEILGYLGPNGAGKSTTVKILIGLLEPSEGRVLRDGRSVIEDLPAFQRRLGYVPEEPNLYPHLSGREYLQLAGRLRGIPPRSIHLLHRGVGIANHLRTRNRPSARIRVRKSERAGV